MASPEAQTEVETTRRSTHPDWGMFAVMIFAAGMVIAGMITGFTTTSHQFGLAQIECATLPDLADSPADPVVPEILLDTDLDLDLLASRAGISRGLDLGYQEELEAAAWYLAALEGAECARRARQEWWKPIGLMAGGLTIAGVAGVMWAANDPRSKSGPG